MEYFNLSMVWVTIMSVVPLTFYLLSIEIQCKLKRFLQARIAQIRHVDGHVMPCAPIRWRGYMNVVNFFGEKFNREYGKIYHLWHGLEPVLILSDTESLRTFYKDHFAHKRDDDFTVCGKQLKDLLGRCLGVCHGRERVREYKGYFEPFFTANAVNSFHTVIGQSVDDWMISLPVNEPIDLRDSPMMNIPIKILTTLCYGERVSEKHHSTLCGFVPKYNSAFSNNGSMYESLCLSRLGYWLNLSTTGVQKFKEEWSSFHQMLLNERDNLNGQDKNGIFFELHDQIKAGNINLSEVELLQTLCQIWLLNLDISAAASTLLLYDMAKHTDIQVKVHQELQTVLGGENKEKESNLGSNEHNVHVSDPAHLDDLSRDLPYLHMVMRESARMTPSLWLTFPERTVKDVTNISGYLVPKGTIACVDANAINHDPELWKNPGIFDPERFSPEMNLAPYSFFRFGLGPRKCLGYRFASPLIMILTAKVLQQFEVSLVENDTELHVRTEGFLQFCPYVSPPLVFKKRTF